MADTSQMKDVADVTHLSSEVSRKSISPAETQVEAFDSASNRAESHTSTHGSLRRSKRDPNCAQLERPDVRSLVEKIRKNHKDTIVFKIKDHIPSDISSSVLDELIHSFYRNKVCQAMYVQNISRAMGDTQLKSLLELLKRKQIWCLNIGENYEVTKAGWEYFCATLPETNITHLYVSEHVIHIDLKNKMREYIRANRKKHDKHCSFKNLRVIEKCTNMWWNPINAIKHQIDQKFFPQHDNKPNTAPNTAAAPPLELTPQHTAYWAEGVGEGGSTPWKFNCVCGEVCSSYERYIYHPTGRMYECTRCHIWSHVDCVLGKISNDDLEELTEVYCGTCKAKVRRQKLLELKELNVVWENGRVVSDGNNSDDESTLPESRASLVEESVSRLVDELNKQHNAKNMRRTSTEDNLANAMGANSLADRGVPAAASPVAAPTTPASSAAPEPLIQPMNAAQQQKCEIPLLLPPPPMSTADSNELADVEMHEITATADHGDDDGSYGCTSNESSSGDTCGTSDTSVGVNPSSPRTSEPEISTQCSDAPATGEAAAAAESMIEESILSTIMHSPPQQMQAETGRSLTPLVSENVTPFKSEVGSLLPMTATTVPSLSHLPIPHIEINYSIPQITNRSRARSETTVFPADATPLLIPNAMQNDWANKNSFLTELNTSSAPLLIKDILSRASFSDNNRHRSFSVADMYDPRRSENDSLSSVQTLASNGKVPGPSTAPPPPKVKAESKKSEHKEKPHKEKAPKQPKTLKVKTDVQANANAPSTESAPRKRRQSKGVRFQIYSRVYIPSIQRQGCIIQEKNGGWKYVQLDDIGDGVTDGKWCRACDMSEIQGGELARPLAQPVAPPSAENMDEEMMFKRRRADSTGSDLFFGEDSLIQPHPTILTLTPDMSGFDDWPALGSTEGMDHFLEGLDAMDEWNL